MTSPSARLTVLAALAAPLLGACAHALSTPLDIKHAEGDNPGNVLYAADEVQFEAPGAFRPLVADTLLVLAGVGDCAKRRVWGRPGPVNTESQGRAFRTNCASVAVVPISDLTTEACLDERQVTFRFPYLLTSSSYERSRVQLAGIDSWQLLGRFAQDDPGEHFLYLTCAPRPWLFSVWIPRDDAATGGLAHGLFLRTIRFEPRTVAAK